MISLNTQRFVVSCFTDGNVQIRLYVILPSIKSSEVHTRLWQSINGTQKLYMNKILIGRRLGQAQNCVLLYKPSGEHFNLLTIVPRICFVDLRLAMSSCRKF